jgi:predicted ribosomally synthesized peptide with nif11-like leader
MNFLGALDSFNAPNSLSFSFVAVFDYESSERPMSATTLQEFFAKVSEDQALQTELSRAMTSENYCQFVVDLASSQGYHFTVEELTQAIDAWHAQADAGELEEEELESIAGGFGWVRQRVCGSVAMPATVKFPIPLLPLR